MLEFVHTLSAACCIHDFYIYYGLLHSLFPCMYQSKEIIANFIVIYQMSDYMYQTKHAYMLIQEIEHRDSIFTRY